MFTSPAEGTTIGLPPCNPFLVWIKLFQFNSQTEKLLEVTVKWPATGQDSANNNGIVGACLATNYCLKDQELCMKSYMHAYRQWKSACNDN